MTEKDDSAPVAPQGLDTERPAAARIYDWYLGGEQNWAVDREFGKKADGMWPHAKHGSKHNREFMNRAVVAALDAGVRQFIDLGSGVPTTGNVHEVVHEHLPRRESATVVYVDYEQVAAAHATVILEQQDATEWAGLVQADVRDVPSVLNHETTRRLIDFEKPVCLLMMALMHFVGPDDHPAELIEAYKAKVAAGSWLALSQMSAGGTTGEDRAGVLAFVERYKSTSNPVWLRDREEIEPWFDGWSLLEPGVVHLPDWRPERRLNPVEALARPYAWCGVAEKP